MHDGSATYLSFGEWKDLVSDGRVDLAQRISSIMVLSGPPNAVQSTLLQIPASWAVNKERALLEKIIKGCVEIHGAKTRQTRGMSF